MAYRYRIIKMTNYVCSEADLLAKFEDEVNALIEQGFKLVGNLVVTYIGTQTDPRYDGEDIYCYHQPMLKE